MKMALSSPTATALWAWRQSRIRSRVFATDQSGIRVLAVSQDNKLLAVGDSSGMATVWQLR